MTLKKQIILFIFIIVMGIIWYSINTQREYLTSMISLREEHVKKRNSNINLENVYSILIPINQAIAWTPMVLHIIRSQPMVNLLIGQTAFRAEAKHLNEVFVLNFKHIGNDSYNAEFLPSFGGTYTITIVITFVNGEQFNSTSHMTAKMIAIAGSPFHLTVKNQKPPKGITRYCSQWESGTARGRWVRCGSLKGIEKCGPRQLKRADNFDKLHDFFWLPYSCQLHYYTNLEMKVCLAKNGWKNIIFTGDSHSRFRTYHWVTRLYGKCKNCTKTGITTTFNRVPKLEWVFDARGTRWAITFPSIITQNEIYIEAKNRRSMFSSPLPEIALSGDLYLMNFGHWLLREVKLSDFMAQKIRDHLEAIKLMNITNEVRASSNSGHIKKHKRFLWVNTMSLTWREDKHVINWRMTPSPSIIAYINSLVDTAMEKAGIQIVDAYQVSNARLNAAFDKTHYARMFKDKLICTGVVENAVTNLILNALCNTL